ncbi:FAD-dependent oxidoreductase domain-containing protein 1 [Cephus cinctus]|uniref:FAD-dependent oxidoreductase domain-containing protein 1 n=1 Tax=Cephus cinctus TaxID=211228 RepID=A0AAJ7FR27_CEPCN|nr:FAD-dependent oxidoreductase domain-containing protein 1 [Cephus cinctus]
MFRHVLLRRNPVKISLNYLRREASNSSSSQGSNSGHEQEDNTKDKLPQNENPINRTLRVLKQDVKSFKDILSFWQDEKPEDTMARYKKLKEFPNHVDIVIIGGGAIGSSIAYWLKSTAQKGLQVAVVEKDPTYSKASSVLSVGGLRQQFSLEENIQMSLFGSEFLRNINDYLGVEGFADVDVQFQPHGYLFLASEAGAETLQTNSKLQNSLGARNVILSPQMLRDKFPWINTEGIALGCLGLEKEGWFDPWSLLFGFKRKALSLGVDYIDGEAVDFIFVNKTQVVSDDPFFSTPQELVVRLPNGTMNTISFSIAIIAAGAFSNNIARKANIGTGKGLLSVPLPVEPRKRYVYCFHSPDGPGLNTPLTIDPSDTYFRREGLGGCYICGRSPEFAEEEPSIDNLDVDHKFFEEKIWPILAQRVKSFENLKVVSSWAGYYEFNTFDENGIIGMHPRHNNICFATGFSGHGIQQAPAVGRAIMELIVYSEFRTINLSKMGFDRFINIEPIRETNIV